MGAQNSGLAVLPDGLIMDDDNSRITTAVPMAPVTAARKPFIQPDAQQRVLQAGN